MSNQVFLNSQSQGMSRAAWRNTQTAGSVAPLVLTCLLAGFVAFGFWAAFTIRNSAGDLLQADRIRGIYDDANTSVVSEESLERKYRLEPSQEVLSRYQDAASSFAVALRGLETRGEEKDAALGKDLETWQLAYLASTRRMFKAVDAGETDLVEQIDTLEVDPAFGAIQDVVMKASAEHHDTYLSKLNKLDTIRRTVLRNTILLGVFGVVFLVAFWTILLILTKRFKKTENEKHQVLRESEERFRALVQESSDLIVVLDAHLRLLYVSSASKRLLGRESESLIGVAITSLINPADVSNVVAIFGKSLELEGAPSVFDARVVDGEDGWHQVEIVCTNRMSDPNIRGLVLNLRDVTERRKLEEELRHQAFHDVLTGLSNRARFMDRLEHALLRTNHRSEALAVLFFDIDGFKSVNDAFGHPVGDAVLREVAQLVTSLVRPQDTVARFGGDEFAILMEEVDSPEQPVELAERLTYALAAAPIRVDHLETQIQVSGGIVLAKDGQPSSDELMRRADVALYIAKGHGRGRFEVYEATMHSKFLRRLGLAGDIMSCLSRGELFLQYQPTFSLVEQTVTGFEALLRWQHPELGLLEPTEFVPIAEETGAIQLIGDWILEEACRQACRWQSVVAGRSLSMSINISTRQFQPGTLAATVKRLLLETGLPASSLILEITESVMLEDFEYINAQLVEIRSMGVRISLDDFGTGFSSLSYLHNLAIDEIKIDRSFVREVGTRTGRQLIATITELARVLKLTVVAEGIEEAGQISPLRELNCDIGQGYIFARPLDPADVDAFLAQADPAEAAA